MKVALAQINPTVGDLDGNVALLEAAATKAAQGGSQILVSPELAVSGYPPKDLLLREGFVNACDRRVESLAKKLDPRLAVIVGHPTHWGAPEGYVANAASVLLGGKILRTVHKRLLPNYDVFDERRYFRPGAAVAPVELMGRRLGIHVCEDAWWGEPATSYHIEPASFPDPVAELAAAGVDAFINVSSSPFELDKPNRRTELLRRHVGQYGVPFLFVNQVGGNDDLVFDGHSLVLDARANVVCRLPGFETDFCIVDLDNLSGETPPPLAGRESMLLDALVLGLRDYMRKCGFDDCVLGLSGGIDSALAAYVAKRAVGSDHVHALLMPSRYSSDHSVSDARLLAENLDIDHETIPIEEIHRAYENAPVVGDDLQSQPGGTADQNLQARIRGALIMVRANRYGWMALATGNKSELAIGYCTLYGDMAGGFAVLADVLKRDVYAVSRFINEQVEGREVIPEHILTKKPSAELAPGQFDQDDLPDYDTLDAILEGLIEREASVESLSKHFPAEIVAWVARRLDRNEFKRRQMPPGIKLSQRAFGSGRRMPMAARFDWGVPNRD